MSRSSSWSSTSQSSSSSSSARSSSSSSSRSRQSRRKTRAKRREGGRLRREENEGIQSRSSRLTNQPVRGAAGFEVFFEEMRGCLADTRDYQRASALRMEQERMEKSTIGQCAARQKFLARFLAARDYRDENPEMSPILRDLLATKNPLTQWQMTQDMVGDARPPGMISQSGATHFLSKGFLDENQPGGFTLFVFSPFKKVTQNLSQRKKDMKLAYGEVGKLSDEDVENLAKNGYHLHLPTSDSQARDMLKVGIWFLEELTCRKGIASEGHRAGLKLMDDHRSRFREASEKDSGFPAKFLCYLDTLFQHFCKEFKDLAQRSNPIRQAKRKLRYLMVDEVKETFRGFSIYGIVPQLNHPVLDDDECNDRKPAARGDRDSSLEPPPEWFSKNPKPKPEWATPLGKKHGDFFYTSTQHGKENVSRLPHCRHHRTGRLQTMCAKHQATGKCLANCRQSHIRISDMDAELESKADDAFRKACGQS